MSIYDVDLTKLKEVFRLVYSKPIPLWLSLFGTDKQIKDMYSKRVKKYTKKVFK